MRLNKRARLIQEEINDILSGMARHEGESDEQYQQRKDERKAKLQKGKKPRN